MYQYSVRAGPNWAYKLRNDRLQESEKGNNLGVDINNRLSPEEHKQERVKNIHNLLACIDEEMLKKIITSFICPMFE